MGFLKGTYLFALLGLSLLVTVTSDCKSVPQTAPASTAEEFVFVEKGVAKVPVILYKDAPPRTVEAAKEFANYISKISGARVELIIDNPKAVPAKAVWLGFQPSVKSLFRNLDFNLKQEEIIIAANTNHLLIMGRDIWNKDFPNVVSGKKVIKNFQEEYGTVNAIYTFLQDYLEVRWFMPGELGEDIQKRRDIMFKPFTFRFEPPIKARSGLFITMIPGSDIKEGVSELWSARNRVYNSSVHVNGGHPFDDWWQKYGKSHPEIFALTEQGSRKPLGNPAHVKLCVSNSAIDAIWLKEVEEQLNKNPFASIFNVNENDGYTLGHCTCSNCRKLDVKDMFGGQPNFADRYIHFANRLGRGLNKKYPGKNYRVNYFAYGKDQPVPLKEKPAGNVVVTSVSNFHLRRAVPFNPKEHSIGQFESWSGIATELVWRPNLGSPVGLQWGFPDIAPSQAFEDFRYVSRKNTIGIFFDSFHEHWATQGPQYYVTAQLAWNPVIDKEELLDDYYERFYGPASGAMNEYWTLVETTRQQHFIAENMSKYSRFSTPKTYSKSWFKKSYALLENATRTVENNKNNIYARRVAFAKEGLAYTELMVTIRQEMVEFEKGIDRKNEIGEMWNKLERLKKKMNPLAINFQYIKYNEDRKNKSSLMMGLVPNDPLSGPTLKNLKREEADKE